jgi:hypothetical protein
MSAAELPTLEFRVGAKKIYGVGLPDGRYRMICDCDVYPNCLVEVYVTAGQANALASGRGERKSVQSILPDAPRELREIFISGTTPAEWDKDFRGKVKKPEKYPGYVIVE